MSFLQQNVAADVILFIVTVVLIALMGKIKNLPCFLKTASGFRLLGFLTLPGLGSEPVLIIGAVAPHSGHFHKRSRLSNDLEAGDFMSI